MCFTQLSLKYMKSKYQIFILKTILYKMRRTPILVIYIFLYKKYVFYQHILKKKHFISKIKKKVLIFYNLQQQNWPQFELRTKIPLN